MRQERCGVFETNSSSTHSICITKNRKAEIVLPEKLYVRCGNFGWDERKLETPEDKVAYLYAAILSLYNRRDVEIAKNRIFIFLGEVGVDCDFEQAEYERLSWCNGYIYCINASLDHACEGDLPKFVENVLRNRGRLLRFLFSDESFVLTGNDNIGTDINICAEYRHEKYYKGG